MIEKENADVVVIDSIQTMYNRGGFVGTGKCITGARVHRNVLMQLAKGLGIFPLLL